jgi:hypothetical protein
MIDQIACRIFGGSKLFGGAPIIECLRPAIRKKCRFCDCRDAKGPVIALAGSGL